MATTVLETRVFAMFPLDPTRIEHSDWNWIHCLTFPRDALNRLRFSSKPYKWIRYATGVVVGAQGDLSFGRDPPHDIVDYNDDLPHQSAALYYHTSDAEKGNMFPADPDMGRTTTTTSSNVTACRADFCSDVIERDQACVLTDYEARISDAVHLLPHSKANEYIENYTRRRSRDPRGTDIVYHIDDSRNGILLNAVARKTFGIDFALLMTPNFAMTTTDVDSSGTAPPTEKRCTAHLFVPNKEQLFGDPALRSGHHVRMSDTADKWPPNVLFDAVYANTVLHHFSTQTLGDALARWKSSYYPGGITSAAQASQQAITDERTTRDERRNEQSGVRHERAGRRAKHAADDRVDFYDCLMILPYLMVPPEKQDEVWRRAAEQSAERERKRVEDKVVGWAREVADASPR